jgi:hypothetical protein
LEPLALLALAHQGQTVGRVGLQVLVLIVLLLAALVVRGVLMALMAETVEQPQAAI